MLSPEGVHPQQSSSPGSAGYTSSPATMRAGAVYGCGRIDVEDTGHGMDAETLARVFEPYSTTKPVGAGSGLGLPQVQAFARQSGGDVRITSAPGGGTCVTFYAMDDLLDALDACAAAGTPAPLPD